MTNLLKAIEKDAKNFFNADFMCCDSIENNLYLKMDLIWLLRVDYEKKYDYF